MTRRTTKRPSRPQPTLRRGAPGSRRQAPSRDWLPDWFRWDRTRSEQQSTLIQCGENPGSTRFARNAAREDLPIINDHMWPRIGATREPNLAAMARQESCCFAIAAENGLVNAALCATEGHK